VRRVEQRPHFLKSLSNAGVRARSPQSVAIMTTVRNLASAEILPGPLDYETIVPPVHRWWVRRLGGLNLWLYYRVRDDVLYLLVVTREPPVPFGED
jgi:hypothetical protein